jgi:hypothetical protein
MGGIVCASGEGEAENKEQQQGEVTQAKAGGHHESHFTSSSILEGFGVYAGSAYAVCQHE